MSRGTPSNTPAVRRTSFAAQRLGALENELGFCVVQVLRNQGVFLCCSCSNTTAGRRQPFDVDHQVGGSWPFASREEALHVVHLALCGAPRRLVLPHRQCRRRPRCRSDEALLRLQPTSGRDERLLEPCSRCGGDLVLQWNGPWGSGVWMELCPACDADRPAARAFIPWHRDRDRDRDRDPDCDRDRDPEDAAPVVRGPGGRGHACPRLGPRGAARGSRVPAGPPPCREAERPPTREQARDRPRGIGRGRALSVVL
ncbi:DUF6300 family protein [Streptomyces sp. NPDC056948]|uniref:DUF6300 family protein n=1 Tax=Streptomyces sp. NPDC056948 TaxID=3345975 RepID=UPI00364132E5